MHRARSNISVGSNILTLAYVSYIATKTLSFFEHHRVRKITILYIQEEKTYR